MDIDRANVTKIVIGLAMWSASLNAAQAAAVNAINDLPLSVKAVYETLCHDDYWIDNKRKMEGSASATFADGTAVFLLVCGDAALSVPYSVILMAPSGDAREAPISWKLKGKDLGEGSLGNARFGPQTGTIVSSGHISATCEPSYTHRWDGRAFQLVALDKGGCRRGEL